MATESGAVGSEADMGSEIAAPGAPPPFVDKLERAEGYVYWLVAILFLATAILALGYTVMVVPTRITEHGVASAIVTLVNDLLLVVIILEVLRTILDFLRTQVLALHPFLVIAAISATRRILTIGAMMALEEDPAPEVFNRAMIDLGVNAGAILVLAVALYLTRLGDVREKR